MRCIAAFFVILVVAGGCASDDGAGFEFVERPAVVAAKIPAPKAVKRPEPVVKARYDVPSDWIAPAGVEKKWTAVVIHHSGTASGNSAIFDRAHREENRWDGVGYDFVIGNGSDSGDGEVEVTFRWRQQRTGAHCKTPGNWANEDAVGICLVGDFNNTRPTSRQMASLSKLVRFLQRRYGIGYSRVYGHNTTPGARGTACPGRNFSMPGLKLLLGS